MQMKIFKPNPPHGYSLIEVVVVLVVAAIILPALILPFVEGVRELDIPVVRGNLAFLAQEIMEKNVVCFSYQSVVEWTNSTSPSFDNHTAVDTAFGPVVDDVKQITITVTNGDQSFSLVTVITDWE